MMHYMMIPFPVARDPRMGKRELLVYGALCGMTENVHPNDVGQCWPTMSEVVEWTGLEAEVVSEVVEFLVQIDWLDEAPDDLRCLLSDEQIAVIVVEPKWNPNPIIIEDADAA